MNSTRKLWLIPVVLLALGSIAHSQESQPVLAVFEVENRKTPLTPDELQALREFLAGKLGEQGRYRIIPRGEMSERLQEKKKESYRACYDQACQIEIGRELAASYSVSTTLSRLGDTCIITCAMYDLEKGVSKSTASAKGPCTANDMVAAMGRVAIRLMEKPERPRATAILPPPRKADKTLNLATVLVGFQFNATVPIKISFTNEHPQADKEDIYLGLTMDVDFFLSQRFFFGLSTRVGFWGGLTIGHIALRSGTSFRLAERVLFSPYLLGGLALWEYPENNTSSGWVVGAGATIRYLFSRSFGLSADLVLSYDSTDNDENRDTPRAWSVLTGISVGLYVGF